MDVFLISYPRSGNTWLRYLLANLLCPSETWTIVNIGRIVPDLHEDLPDNPVVSTPRLAKSHETFNASYRKAVYLYRDGRDVAVSLYDFSKKLRGYEENFSIFLLQMLEGRVDFGSWQNHVQSWMSQKHNLDLLPIAYEDLCKNTEAELARLGTFIGKTWDEESLRSAISASTLTRQNEDFRKYKRETHWDRGFRGGVRGKPGAWREIFTPELHELFWMHAGEVASSLGYRAD